MGRELEAPGAAHLVLADGVVHLDPEQAVFQAMLAGWERQQRSRFLNDATIGPRLVLLRRMAVFTNSYPWQWEPADGEDFITHLRSAGRKRPIVVSTARGYELSITLFMQYVTDPRYGWPAECSNRFGRVPQQVFHDGNSIVHVADFEGQPGRRPLTYDEVQALFDAADSRADKVRGCGRKGVLTALRDSAVLKTVYAFGLRRREAHGLDLVDRRRAPKAPQYGEYGAWFVRWGKASQGSPPRRRTVLTVPEMDWVVDVRGAASVPAGSVGLVVGQRAGGSNVDAQHQPGVRAGSGGGWAATGIGPAFSAAFLRDSPDRVRLPGTLRLRAGRTPLCGDNRDLHRCFGRVPNPVDPPGVANPDRAVEGT